ncbi:MAG: quinolinate synthase NadA [Chitinophagales bacterium]
MSELERMPEAELIAEINRLKKEKDAVVLAHYYMTPDLQVLQPKGGVADFIGDSLGLSVEATKVQQQNIVFCGVKFMAETAKILNPARRVFIPDMEAGCSLASSITGADVRALRAQYPGAPVIAYVNTYAETKAEVDICCTSRNALQIAKSMEADTLIFVPDLYMGQNLQRKIEAETGKKMILWNGSCEVHEQFKGDNLKPLLAMNPDAEMLLHWEVPRDTVEESMQTNGGVLGSTNDILKYVGSSKANKFILASECDLGATLKGLYPEKEFITPCIKCPYMKKITLQNTLATLRAIGTNRAANYEVTLEEDIMRRAYEPIKKMLAFA